MPGTPVTELPKADCRPHAAHRTNYSTGPSIAFGRFRLFPWQRLLLENDNPVHLGSRAFDILVALLERPGTLLSNEELMARVWPKTFIAPVNVAVNISALRRALGDGHEGNRYVVNIPGRGYGFVAPVAIEGDLDFRFGGCRGDSGRHIFHQRADAPSSL
jgi:DNA-binding winged helix-turn-helix (wHTH) protein